MHGRPSDVFSHLSPKVAFRPNRAFFPAFGPRSTRSSGSWQNHLRIQADRRACFWHGKLLRTDRPGSFNTRGGSFARTLGTLLERMGSTWMANGGLRSVSGMESGKNCLGSPGSRLQSSRSKTRARNHAYVPCFYGKNGLGSSFCLSLCPPSLVLFLYGGSSALFLRTGCLASS